MKAFCIAVLLVVAFTQSASTSYNINGGANTTPQSTRVAQSCQANYYWSTQSCQPCASATDGNAYCTCSTYNTCTTQTCLTGYSKVGSVCYQIPSNCLTYGLTSSSNALICFSCATGYSLVGGICILNNNCTQYSTTNAICTGCNAGFYFNWNLQLSTGTTVNSYASYFNNFSGFCSPCMAGCSSCSGPTTCATCASGYYWNAPTSTTYLTALGATGAGSCTACMTGCSACTSSTTCTACMTTYYLPTTTTGSAVSCATCSSLFTNCMTCSATACQTCSSGYYLVTSTTTPCVTCPTTCTTCSAASVCTACISGYLLSSTGTCVACPSNCTSCTFLTGQSGSTTCKACQDLFYLVVGTTTTPTTCSLCTSSNSQFLRCQGPGENSSLTSVVPTQCTNGFYLVTVAASGTTPASTTCVAQAASPVCLTLSTNVNTSCLTCITGYQLVGTQCLACTGGVNGLPTGCTTCTVSSNALVCTTCAAGYIQGAAATAGGSVTCTACSSNCSACSSATTCTTCISAYFLSSGSCSPCGSNCTACSSSTVCTTCSNGFYLNSVTTSSGTVQTATCYSCQPNCATCTSPGSACLTCVSGYVLQNGGCVSLSQANCNQASSTSGCTVCNYGFYLLSNECYQCLQPYAGFVCRQNEVQSNSTTNGTTPAVQYGYIISILALLLVF